MHLGGEFAYDAGAWRVPTQHRKTIDLFRDAHEELLASNVPAVISDDDIVRGLSGWDVKAMNCRNALTADHMDLSSGLPGLAHSACGSVGSDGTYLLPKNGFESIVKWLEHRCHIMYGTRVVDVRRSAAEYIIQCRCLNADGSFVNRTYASTAVFICVPPHCAERWTIVSQWGRAQTHSVIPMPMNRVYALAHTDADADAHARFQTKQSLLGQSILPQQNGWFQPSYTSGRLARFWHNLERTSQAQFQRLVVEETQKQLRLQVRHDTIVSHFWECAFHMWRPNPSFHKARAVELAVMPNLRHLPNVYWCGEAFSSFQGWVEGALETADMALEVFTRARAYILPRCVITHSQVSIEGRIVDVEAISSPQRERLRQCAGQDATDSFYHDLPSRDAWSRIFSLQTGVA